MKLFLVTNGNLPDVYFKAESDMDALKSFKKGMTAEGIALHMEEPSFVVKEIKSLENLMSYLPDEFKIDDDASF